MNFSDGWDSDAILPGSKALRAVVSCEANCAINYADASSNDMQRVSAQSESEGNVIHKAVNNALFLE